MSPALAGGFLTTGPPGKSMKIRFFFFFWTVKLPNDYSSMGTCIQPTICV